MAETIFIGVAWPYANGSLHIGGVTGAYLPADIFARYHRLVGNRVLMVSGSDMHGTPVTVRAEKEGVSPEELADRYHAQHVDNLTRLGISYDLYTKTTTDIHRRVVQDMFLTLHKRGHIYTQTTTAPYCPVDRRFLPDRYVEGTCPRCGYTEARGDQCDNDGMPLDPIDLIDPHCRLCGTPPEFRPTEHFFLKLTAFQDELERWLAPKASWWKPNVIGEALGVLREGLKDRPITRDILWGVPIPLPGFDDKRIYVWFDAFIGYWSGSIEWAERSGQPEAWKPFWFEPSTKAHYFLGKDNIFFHTIMWPMVLMAYGDLNLPHNVPANAYLNDETGQKMSKSRAKGVMLPEYLEYYDPDALRYLFTAIMPETRDSSFAPDELLRRNNDELVATYGNFVHRVLTFVWRHFDGTVPTAESLASEDRVALAACERSFDTVGGLIASCQFKEGLREVMALAGLGNRYLDDQAPWRQIKLDRERCGTSLHVCLQIAAALRTLTQPFLPFSAQRLHEMLGGDGTATATGWRFVPLAARTRLREPAPLFKKLED